MNINALNILIWILSAFFFLLNTLIIACGKRIIKQKKWLLDIANLLLLAYFFTEAFNSKISLQYILLAVMIILFLRIVIGFFTGSEYKVYVNNKGILLKSIDNAISSVMTIKAVQQEKEESTLFILGESNNKIQVKDVDEKSYIIKFKKWTHYDLKKQILVQISDELDQYDSFPVNKAKVTLQIVSAILLMIIGLFATSYIVMENKQIDFENEKVPNEIYFIKKDFSYTHEDGIESIHEHLQNTYNYTAVKKTYDQVMERTQFVFEYGYKEIYVGHDRMYIFVKDTEIRDKSIFHWICWRLHHIYDKKKGTYYAAYCTDELYNIVKGIVED